MFSFNFTFTVPGVPNPFAAASSSNLSLEQSSCAQKSSLSAPTVTVNPVTVDTYSAEKKSRPPLRHGKDRRAPSPLPPAPLSRKRGWVPSTCEPSYASTIPHSTSGYLDTPAKYRKMAETETRDNFDYNTPDQDEMEGELPPAKRRRTLAGSIVSTALSAALIGTAVGLTVYRLWRDRGSDNALPPSYQESERSQQSLEERPQLSVSTSSPRSRRPRGAAGRRSAASRHRKTHSRPQTFSPAGSTSPPSSSAPPSGPFDFRLNHNQEQPEPAREEEEEDDEMDWIGDRIAKLIEEGKKALGKEIVVMSDAKEDEVDDGSGAWEEDDEPDDRSIRSSPRKRTKAPRNIGLPPSYSSQHLGLPSPSSPGFSISSRVRPNAVPSQTLPFHTRTSSFENSSPTLPSSSYKESEGDWQSLEIKASMEKARQLYLSRQRR